MRVMNAIKGKARKFYNSYSRIFHKPYNSEEFTISLKKLGIGKGDSVFVRCAADTLKEKIGEMPPINLIVNDVLDLVGAEGTLLTLGFSKNRDEIINGKITFDTKKTQTENGIFAELIRRRKGAERSLHPIFSAIAYGKNAKKYCDSHHLSLYPFGEQSPYYKIIADGGKYLGIGVGFEGFSLAHTLDDYYKEQFIHKLFQEEPVSLAVLNKNDRINVKTFIRKTGDALKKEVPTNNPSGYFKLLQPVKYEKRQDRSGINLFLMDMKSFFESAVKLYDSKKITWWNAKI